MQYLGGKNRTRKQIAAFLESKREPGQTYFEPFVGGAWVLQEMSDPRVASDGNVALITLYKAIQRGWEPPSEMTESEYLRLKGEQDPDNPLTAFVGIGCSHSGKWFGGFARSGTRNYCANARNSLLKQKASLASVHFDSGDYRLFVPENSLVYCDPPYANTTGYGALDDFDSTCFWETMRKWSINNTVVISEYEAPSDFVCVLEMQVKTDMRVAGTKEARVERVFMYKG